MPAVKRRNSAATHEEVYRLVRQKKIRLAEDLLTLAKAHAEAPTGDSELLLYCSGEQGMKGNLQATVNAIWTSSSDEAACKAEYALSGHGLPLNTERLIILQARAREPIKGAAASLFFTVTMKTGPPSGKRTLSNKDEIDLFDQFGHRAEVVFRPRSGLWRLRDFFELLVFIRSEDGIDVSPTTDGFIAPRSEEGWTAMLRTGVARPEKGFDALGEDELTKARGQVRFGVGCGELRWNVPAGRGNWIDAMPEDEHFERNVLSSGPSDERLVRFWAANHVEVRHWVAFVRALIACGHELQETVGFKLKGNNFQVTGSTNKASRHKCAKGIPAFGTISAIANGGKTEAAGMLSLLGHGAGAPKLRPDVPRGVAETVMRALPAPATTSPAPATSKTSAMLSIKAPR